MVKCDKCEFEAKSEFGLRSHMRIKHGVTAPKVEQPIPDIKAVEEDTNLIPVSLKNTININGKRYGGNIMVEPSLAQDLRYRDKQVTLRLERETTTRVIKERYLGDIR